MNPKCADRLSDQTDPEMNLSRTDPAIVIVSGVASGAGKTSLAVAVIEFLRQSVPVAAVKITVTHDDRGCPHGGKSCNVCSSLGGDFQIVSRRDIIEQPGTDTARFVEAGAEPVHWGITRDTSIVQLWERMIPLVTSTRFVVVESNTLALNLKGKVNLMIVDPTVSRRLWKPSATALIGSADLVIFNERGNSTQRESTWSELTELRPVGTVLKVDDPTKIKDYPALSTVLNSAA